MCNRILSAAMMVRFTVAKCYEASQYCHSGSINFHIIFELAVSFSTRDQFDKKQEQTPSPAPLPTTAFRRPNCKSKTLGLFFYICILTNTFRRLNLSFIRRFVVVGGGLWVPGVGKERDAFGTRVCACICVCVCGHVNLANTRDEKTHSAIPLSHRDCTSRFSLGGVFLSSAMRLASKGRISDEHATGFGLFFSSSSEMAQFSHLPQ